MSRQASSFQRTAPSSLYGEALSVNDGDLMHLVDGCAFKGGTNTAVPEYGGTIETNRGHYIEIRDCDIWRWNGPAFNFSADGEESHILLKNLDIDFTPTRRKRRPLTRAYSRGRASTPLQSWVARSRPALRAAA